MGLKPLVVINKVDKENCTPDEVHENCFWFDVWADATEEQLDFPTIYGSATIMDVGRLKKPSQSIVLIDKILDYFPPVK